MCFKILIGVEIVLLFYGRTLMLKIICGFDI
jgi:hypothetical protein